MTSTAIPAKSNPGYFYIFAIFPPLFWAGNFLLARMFRDEIPPFQLSFWRWVIAFIILLVLALPHLRHQASQIRKELPFLAFLGAIGITAFNCLIYKALHHTTVINAALINSLMPVITFLLALIFIGDRLKRRQIAGVLVSVGGALVIIARGNVSHLGTFSIELGDLLVLCGVSFWALYTVLIKWRPTKLPPMVFLAITVGFGTLFHLPLVVWELKHVGGFTPDLPNIAALIYLAVFPSVLAYIFWGRAVAAMGPGKTGIFMHLMPVFSAILAVAFLGEALHAYHFFGIALIFCGIALVTSLPRVSPIASQNNTLNVPKKPDNIL